MTGNYKKDIIGLKKGMITIVSFAYYFRKPGYNYRRSYWNCICKCGNEVIFSRKHIFECKRLSCGCWPRLNAGVDSIRTPEECKKAKMDCILNMSHWEGECLIWDGYCDGKYPMTSYLNIKYVVGRLIWIFEKGSIPPKKYINHTCNCDKCINIKHLKLIDIGENRRGKKHKKKQRL